MASVEYNWLVETLDADMEDIEETIAFPTAALAVAAFNGFYARNVNVRIGLVREDYAPGAFRSWAYSKDGTTLPPEFDCGAKVPKRFHAELARALA